jgi:hypothetical protein
MGPGAYMAFNSNDLQTYICRPIHVSSCRSLPPRLTSWLVQPLTVLLIVVQVLSKTGLCYGLYLKQEFAVVNLAQRPESHAESHT